MFCIFKNPELGWRRKPVSRLCNLAKKWIVFYPRPTDSLSYYCRVISSRFNKRYHAKYHRLRNLGAFLKTFLDVPSSAKKSRKKVKLAPPITRSEWKHISDFHCIPNAGSKALTNLYKMRENFFWESFEFSKNFAPRWAAEKVTKFDLQDILRFLEHHAFTGKLHWQEKQVHFKRVEVSTILDRDQRFSQTFECSIFQQILIFSDDERKQSLTKSQKKDGIWVGYKDNRWAATRISGRKTRFSVRFSSVDKFFLISDY